MFSKFGRSLWIALVLATLAIFGASSASVYAAPKDEKDCPGRISVLFSQCDFRRRNRRQLADVSRPRGRLRHDRQLRVCLRQLALFRFPSHPPRLVLPS